MLRRAILLCLFITLPTYAHPLIQDALDVVISPTTITLTARITPEEITVEQNSPNVTDGQRTAHATYVANHLRLEVDGQSIPAQLRPTPTQPAQMIAYELEYPLPHSPKVVRLYQTLLIDHPPWTVSCVVRFRQIEQTDYDTALLTREGTAEYVCDWSPTTQPAAPPAPIDPHLAQTFRAYTAHGIHHILTGYDHLLFVTALVLAATSLWDLFKVVTAFTLAHTLTLTLSVFNIVTLPERIVEPMISASIVFVALQNIFSPRSSRGPLRLAIAFAFGLFHGLGFAGGLKDAMTDLPRTALWTALIAFSLGVEIGHQLVVLPSFAALTAYRHRWPAPIAYRRIIRAGSALISIAGIYYLLVALRVIKE